MAIYFLISITAKVSLKTAGITLRSKLKGHEFCMPKNEAEGSVSRYKSPNLESKDALVALRSSVGGFLYNPGCRSSPLWPKCLSFPLSGTRSLLTEIRNLKPVISIQTAPAIRAAQGGTGRRKPRIKPRTPQRCLLADVPCHLQLCQIAKGLLLPFNPPHLG